MPTYVCKWHQQVEEAIEADSPEEAADLFKARHGRDAFDVGPNLLRGRCGACGKAIWYGDPCLRDDDGRAIFHRYCLTATALSKIVAASPDLHEPQTACETPVMTRE